MDEIEKFIDGMYLGLLLRTQFYNSTNYDGQAIDYKLQLYIHRLTIDPKSYSHGRVLITEESLESDDKLYSLGMFSKYSTFHTFQKEPTIK